MAVDIVSTNAAQTMGVQQTTTARQTRIRYEVWTDKTMLLRTTHEAQALRYAHEVQGEVRTITQNRSS